MKRKIKNKTNKKTKKENNLFKKHSAIIVVAIVGILALAIFSYFNKTPVVGEAYRVVEEPLDMVNNRSLEVDVTVVDDWQINLDPSSAQGETLYQINTELNEDDTLSYTLTDITTGNTISMGLFGEFVTDSRGIYVDSDDDEPDVEFHYSDGIFEIVNLNFLESGAANFVLKRDTTTLPTIFKQLRDVPVDYTLEIHSLVAGTDPTEVKVFIDGVEVDPLTDATADGDDYLTYTFSFIPTEEKPYVINVSAVVGEESSSKMYILGGEDIIYQSGGLTLTLKDETTQEVDVELSFSGADSPSSSSAMQPFSLPCSGVVTLERSQELVEGLDDSLPELRYPEGWAGLSAFYTYNAEESRPIQYTYGLPSDFYHVDALRGYLVRVQGDQDMTLLTSCTLTEGLPSLHDDYNLVGVTGASNIPQAELDTKVPSNKQITEVLLVGLDKDVTDITGTEDLEPGKAYWVKVE